MKKPEFANGEIYHLYNRGVEKRRIFTKESDYRRFIHNLVCFNDIEVATPANVRFDVRRPSQAKCLEVEPLNIVPVSRMLVELLAFCLMPNHYHLLVRQRYDNGVVRFMQKIGTGYSMYFNLKYKRVGPLFQGAFKAVLVEDEAHFLHLPTYIHANPLDLFVPAWRLGKIRSPEKALRFLEQYRWSSFPDYIGQKNFPAVTQREFLVSVFGDARAHRSAMLQWLRSRNLAQLEDIALESLIH